MRYISDQIRLDGAMTVLIEAIVSQLNIQSVNQPLHPWINQFALHSINHRHWRSHPGLCRASRWLLLHSSRYFRSGTQFSTGNWLWTGSQRRLIPARDLHPNVSTLQLQQRTALRPLSVPPVTTPLDVGSLTGSSTTGNCCRERSNSSRWCHTILLTD